MATLDVRATSDMAAARADVDALGGAVRGLGTDVAAASADARNASVDFDALGEGSDNVASKSSQAAGAMGDLAGGLEAVGLTGAATALEGVALGSQVAAGAGDALNLVSETAAGRFIAQTAATVAHRTATIAGSIATGAMTVAQGALNVVMAANPVVLVVIALAALAAGLVLAYKNSETFRDIVDGAFTKAKQVVEGALVAVKDIIGWFQDLPGEARQAWEAVSKAIGDRIDDAVGFVQDLFDKLDGFGLISTVVSGYFNVMFAPIKLAIGFVQDLINKIGEIDFPDINPLDRSSSSSSGGKPTAGGDPTGTIGTGSAPVVYEITINGAIDPVSTARQLRQLLSDAAALNGAPDWAVI